MFEHASEDREISKSPSAHSSLSTSPAPSLVHRRSSPSVLSSNSRRTPSPSPRRRAGISSSSSSMRHRSSPSVLSSNNGRQTPSPSPLRRLPRSPYRTASLEDVSGHSSSHSYHQSTSLPASITSSNLASSPGKENIANAVELEGAVCSLNRPPSADDVEQASSEGVLESLAQSEDTRNPNASTETNSDLIGQILTPSKVRILPLSLPQEKKVYLCAPFLHM